MVWLCAGFFVIFLLDISCEHRFSGSDDEAEVESSWGGWNRDINAEQYYQTVETSHALDDAKDKQAAQAYLDRHEYSG